MNKHLNYMPLALLLCAFTSCTFNNSSRNVQTNDSSAVDQVEEIEASSVEASEQTSELEGTTWFYSKREDDLTHEITSLDANIVSTNRVRIDSYGNTARLYISLSYSAAISGSLSTSVMLSFVDDNKLCRFSDFQGSGFLAVFDDGDVDDRWGLIDMTKKRDALYMYNTNKVAPFVNKLKASKHARIQVNLEGVGKNTFDFNIAGLKWDFDN